MNEESILFSWGLFAQNASFSITNMWQDRYYTDVTLATMDDKQIKAHKLILSSNSNFFRNIFVKNPHQNPLIFLKDINHKELELVLKFMYHGKCYVEQSDVKNFLATGSLLGVSGLVKEETIETQPLTSSKLPNKKEIHQQQNCLPELPEQSDTGRKYKNLEHSVESTVCIEYTKKAWFEIGKCLSLHKLN